MSINYLEKITEIYCFVSVDEGGEGVIGQQVDMFNGKTFMPFVCADKTRMEQLKPIAKKLSQESGKTIKLVKFKQRKEFKDLFNG